MWCILHLYWQYTPFLNINVPHLHIFPQMGNTHILYNIDYKTLTNYSRSLPVKKAAGEERTYIIMKTELYPQ
jgi:hypothetical protein